MVHRSIDCSTWDDPWFAELAPKAKLLFLFLITNRRVSQCGAMEITVRQIEFETGLPTAEIPNLIESFGDRVRWWHQHSLLIVRNFYRHQRANTGDKFDVAARKSAEVLPDFAREWVYDLYPHLAPEGYTHPIPTPVGSRARDIGSEAEAEAEAEAVVPPIGGAPEIPEPVKPLPLHGEAQKIVAAYCREARIDQPSNYKRAVGQADQMVKAGVRVSDVPSLFGFVASWSNGPDLGTMLSSIDKWRAGKNLPARASPNGRQSSDDIMAEAIAISEGRPKPDNVLEARYQIGGHR